ncbi:MAG TPA: gamma-glutamyl-gamma-aminobutyrate hydrolase family protein [Flavitalea sp.]|nr:gamma-glutamyl-gamma-aminobutyrate hydrolase family protein [Flavitalea sp.]
MKIGITHTGRDDKQLNYIKWIQGNNDEIDIITLSADNGNSVEECDAIVLSGGIDMHPKYYKGNDSYTNRPSRFWEARDDFELKAFEIAIKRSMPVIGVCRGLQLINVYCNGSLVQDLGEYKNNIHKDYTEKETNTDCDNKHNVNVEGGTLLHDIVKVNSALVNSAHHQAIKELGNDLVANSWSDDGIIEGIEWKHKNERSFMLAVQWHPERMEKADIFNSPLSKNIRDYFISAVNSNLKK